jgi:signal transduction histidine kinase
VRSLSLALGSLALGLVVVMLLGLGVLAAPAHDMQLLALMLGLSGSASLALGLVGLRLAPRLGLGRLGAMIIFTHLLVLTVVYFNIVVAANLMFISDHDLGLLGLLLVFSAALALAFAVIISRGVGDAIRALAAAAQRMAGGDLNVRVDPGPSTELTELAEAFNLMAGRLLAADVRRQELERARRELVAAVSHDLRTPLASIRAMVEAINDGVVTDTETVQRYLGTVQAEVGRLSELIDDLFELSRLDAGALELHLSAGSVRDLLSDALEGLQPQAQARGIRLGGSVSADLPPVLMDERRMLRVVYNLVQNALRHTPPDGSVTLGAEELAEAVRIDVLDTGEGIAESDLPRIFERFYRGEKSRTRGPGGAGLGLAIADGIVSAHGGRLWAENRAPQGARFSFTLPKAG